MNAIRPLWRALRALLLALAALWFFLEEFGWHPLATWLGRFARWGPWQRMEARIAALPPRPALVLFLVPVLALLPVKLLALRLLGAGQPLLGLVVILAAKLVGTAIGGRLFVLLRPQLMTLRWFARAMARWRYLRRRVRHALLASAAWQGLRQRARRWRSRWRSLRRRAEAGMRER
ncbi:hypothetical protein [Rhizobacter fulvus]